MSDIQKLKDQRAEVVTQMRDLHAKAEKEDRGFTTDEDAKWGALTADLEQLDGRIKRAEKVGDILQVVPTDLRAAGKFTGREPEERGDQVAEESRVFDRFLRVGMSELTAEERAAHERRLSLAGEPRQRGNARHRT